MKRDSEIGMAVSISQPCSTRRFRRRWRRRAAGETSGATERVIGKSGGLSRTMDSHGSA